MKTYYSAATGNFYSSQHFGTKTKTIIDPAFEWPMIEVPDTNAEPPMVEVPDPAYSGEGEPPMIELPDPDFTPPLISIRDPDVEPPLIEVPNSNCKLPDDAVEISAEYHQELLTGQGSRRIQPDANGYPVLVDPPPISIDDLAKQKRAELDRARDEAFAAGLEYEINGEPDIVQTRPQDQINLLGLSAQAQRLIAAGQPDATLTFRGLQNVNRELTAQEVDALTLAALGHIESIYQKSWQRKDALDAAHVAGDREAIEALVW